MRLLSSATSAARPGRGRTLWSEQWDIVTIVFADEFHDLVHARSCIAHKRAGRSPLPGCLLRIFENDLVEEVGGAGACETLDGVKLIAGLLNAADRMLAVYESVTP